MKLVLLEDTGDYRDKIVDLLSKTSVEAQKGLTSKTDEKGNPKIDRDQVDNQLNWQRGYNASRNTDDENIISNAYVILLKEGPVKVKIPEDTDDLVAHIIRDLGFQRNSNPFFKYFTTMNTKNARISRNDVILLNNLYSDGTIDFEDLNKETNNLLYNVNLFNQTNYLPTDRQELIKTYEWAKHNLKLNSDNLKKIIKLAEEEKNTAILSIVNNFKSNPSVLESGDSKTGINYIFTKNGDIQSGEIFPYYSINAFINTYSSMLNTGNTEEKDNKDKPQEADKTEETGSSRDLNDDVKKPIDDLIRNGKLNRSQLNALRDYLKQKEDTGDIR